MTCTHVCPAGMSVVAYCTSCIVAACGEVLQGTTSAHFSPRRHENAHDLASGGWDTVTPDGSRDAGLCLCNANGEWMGGRGSPHDGRRVRVCADSRVVV